MTTYPDIVAALTAVAAGAKCHGDVATALGVSIAQAGAVLLQCERGGYLPTDSDGVLLFKLTPASRLLVDEAIAAECAAVQPGRKPAWLTVKLSQGGTSC